MVVLIMISTVEKIPQQLLLLAEETCSRQREAEV